MSRFASKYIIKGQTIKNICPKGRAQGVRSQTWKNQLTVSKTGKQIV